MRKDAWHWNLVFSSLIRQALYIHSHLIFTTTEGGCFHLCIADEALRLAQATWLVSDEIGIWPQVFKLRLVLSSHPYYKGKLPYEKTFDCNFPGAYGTGNRIQWLSNLSVPWLSLALPPLFFLAFSFISLDTFPRGMSSSLEGEELQDEAER